MMHHKITQDSPSDKIPILNQHSFLQISQDMHPIACLWRLCIWWVKIQGGGFKNTYELLNPRALKISTLHKILSFNVWVRYFVWNFKGTLWNSTQNILPIHWKLYILYTDGNLRALRFKSSYVFLKCPLIYVVPQPWECYFPGGGGGGGGGDTGPNFDGGGGVGGGGGCRWWTPKPTHV